MTDRFWSRLKTLLTPAHRTILGALILCATVATQAQAPTSTVVPLPASSAPRELFHWTDATGLREFAASLLAGQPLPGAVRDEHRLGAGFPDLVGRPALYAWTDTVTGLATSSEEIYPDRRGERPELVRLRLRDDLRVVQVTSDGLDFEAMPLTSAERELLKNADLILHRWGSDDRLILREWIILNPSALTEIESDPARLRATIERDWRLLPARLQTPEKLHWSLMDGLIEEICLVCYEHGRETARGILDRFLTPDPERTGGPRGPLCAGLFR
jgi:hypothetical protein